MDWNALFYHDALFQVKEDNYMLKKSDWKIKYFLSYFTENSFYLI